MSPFFLFQPKINSAFSGSSKRPCWFTKTVSGKIPTSQLNDVMLKAVESYHPPVVRGNAVKIKYVTQLPTQVPSFAFFCNFPDDIKEPYRNYLENQLREKFYFKGVPVRICLPKAYQGFPPAAEVYVLYIR